MYRKLLITTLLIALPAMTIAQHVQTPEWEETRPTSSCPMPPLSLRAAARPSIWQV